MKVLDPQSAILTNAEVHQFMLANTPRKADKKVGAYAVVDLKDHVRVRQDFQTYVKDVMAYTHKIPSVELWMSNLVAQLKQYRLTQTEVMNLINLGVGLRDGSNNVDADMDENGDATAANNTSTFPGNDEVLFKLVVEEHDERFPGEDGAREIEEIIVIIGEAIRVPATGNGKVS